MIIRFFLINKRESFIIQFNKFFKDQIIHHHYLR